MKLLPITNPVRLAIGLVAAAVLVSPDELRAERVGFSFEGALQQIGTPGTYTLFGISVPKTSPVAGTFSYDTTTPGVDTEPGVRTFHQLIQGGYTLNINSGAIQLSASDYVVTVANDFPRIPEAVDIFSVDYNYDSINGITPAPINVNGGPWGGTRAFIKVELSWLAATFTDPDEPKLTSDRPLTPIPGVSAFVGSSASPRFFSVTSIAALPPLLGDYNRNGTVDSNDLAEWRKAFGAAGEPFLYADGNGDGVVDAADYVVWRKALGSIGAGGALPSAVPEPTGLMLAAMGLIVFAVRWL